MRLNQRTKFPVVGKTITVSDQQDGWIKAQIEAGHHTNDSERILDLIRRKQECSAEVNATHAALRAGGWALASA
ncbi:hypothetical protein HBN83_18715 [Pseudomonas fragi]|nr:hypothetical protein [Pseudomonas fragi]